MNDLSIVLTSICLLVFCILLSVKRGINIGVPALGCALFMGQFLLGKQISDLLTYFPVNVMFVIVAGSFFFGFAVNNKTMEILTQHLLYHCRHCGWLTPWAIFLCSMLISGTGAGPTPALVIMAPLSISAAKMGKFNPILSTMAVIFGAQAGSAFVWTAISQVRVGYMLAVWKEESVNQLLGQLMATGPVMFILMFAVGYLVLRGWQAQAADLPAPPKMNGVQRKNLLLIVAGCALVILPALFEIIIPNPVTAFLKTHFDTNTFLAVGSLAAYLLGLGDAEAILRRQIPWGMVFMLIGVNILIGIAVDYGLADMLEQLLANQLPAWLIPGLLGLVGATISLFSGFPVVYPLLLPLIPGLAANSGADTIAMTTAVIFTTGITAMSPFSMAGALMISQLDTEQERQKIIPKQLIYTLFSGLIASVYCCTPFCNLFLNGG